MADSSVMLGGSGLRVSPIALGTMQFGTGLIAVEASEAKRIFETYRAYGGNVIDTAPAYGDHSSAEQQVGDLVHGMREDIVLITKVGCRTDAGGANSAGLGRRAIVQGVHDSLRRLRTDYVDVVMAHVHDPRIDVARWVDVLQDLVRSGLATSWGMSNVPAWVLAEAATRGGMTQLPPDVLQTQYSVVQRDSEHEIIPAARRFGLAVMAWGPLAGGLLGKPVDEGSTLSLRGYVPSIDDHTVADKLRRLAAENGVTASQLAAGWVIASGAIPVVGARTARQLEEVMQWRPLDQDMMLKVDALRPRALQYPEKFLKESREFFFGSI